MGGADSGEPCQRRLLTSFRRRRVFHADSARINIGRLQAQADHARGWMRHTSDIPLCLILLRFHQCWRTHLQYQLHSRIGNRYKCFVLDSRSAVYKFSQRYDIQTLFVRVQPFLGCCRADRLSVCRAMCRNAFTWVEMVLGYYVE